TRSAHGLWPDAGSPRFRRDPFARDVLFDPGRTAVPRITALLMLRSAATDNLRSCEMGISGLNHTPHATAVYASCSALLPPHATLASKRPATALPGPDLHRRIAPAFAGAFLLDHLVGEKLKLTRYSEPERLGGVEVNDQPEFRRRLDWEFARFLAIENTIDVGSRPTVLIDHIRPVGHQASLGCINSIWINGGNAMHSC